jgi:hypothetical protein
MTKRKFYRTVIQIEILSEEPYECDALEDVTYDITEGHCSGELKDVVRNEEKTGKEMAALLVAQRSDPEFFQLTEDGEDLEEDEGCPNCDGVGRDSCPMCGGTNVPFPEED